MIKYKDLLGLAVSDKAKDDHAAAITTVTCQWLKSWGTFHEFTAKNMKLSFFAELSGKLQPFQPIGPKDVFGSVR